MKILILIFFFSCVCFAQFPSVLKWSNVVIGGGGFIPGLIFSPSQKDLLYVRTDIGGAYRWNPTDSSWIPLTDVFNSSVGNYLGAESLATDPKDPNRVYYAGGLYTASWNGNGAIFSSADKGNTWSTRWEAPFKMGGNEDGRSAGERLAVNPVTNNIIYYGSQFDGLWRSTNYGASFSKVTSFPTPSNANNGRGVVLVVFDPNDKTGQTFFVGVDVFTNSLYRTRDGGATWQAVVNQPSGFFPHHLVFSGDGASLYVSYGNGPGPNGITNGAVFKMNVSSGVWQNISPETPGKNGQPNFGYAGLSADKSDPNTLVVATIDRWWPIDDLYRSTDRGQTWKSVSASAKLDIHEYPFLNFGSGDPKFGWWMGTAEIDPFDSNRVLFGTGATIYGTNNMKDLDKGNPTIWTPRVKGLEETAVLDLASPPAGPYLYSAIGDVGGFTHMDVSVSPPQGMWSNPTFGNGYSVNFAENVPNVVVRVGSGNESPARNGAISFDFGKTWTPFASEPVSGANGGVIAISPDASTLVWTQSHQRPYWSSNNGATWTPCQGLTDSIPIIADRIASSTFYGFSSSSGNVYRSVDYGKTFSRGNGQVSGGSSMVASFYDQGDLWVASSNGLFHSVDGGNSFTKMAQVSSCDAVGFGKPYTGKLPTLYIAGTLNQTYGIYGSVDYGMRWQRLNDEKHQWGWLGQRVTGDRQVFGRVYVATNGRGIVMGNV